MPDCNWGCCNHRPVFFDLFALRISKVKNHICLEKWLRALGFGIGTNTGSQETSKS